MFSIWTAVDAVPDHRRNVGATSDVNTKAGGQYLHGRVPEWSGSRLQSGLHWFDSNRGLHATKLIPNLFALFILDTGRRSSRCGRQERPRHGRVGPRPARVPARREPVGEFGAPRNISRAQTSPLSGPAPFPMTMTERPVRAPHNREFPRSADRSDSLAESAFLFLRGRFRIPGGTARHSFADPCALRTRRTSRGRTPCRCPAPKEMECVRPDSRLAGKWVTERTLFLCTHTASRNCGAGPMPRRPGPGRPAARRCVP